MEKLKRILHKLYLTTLALSTLALVLSSGTYLAQTVHDYVVTANDFKCFHAGTFPWERYPTAEVDPKSKPKFDPDAYLRREAVLEKCHVRWNDFYKSYASSSAWGNGLEETPFWKRADTSFNLAVVFLVSTVFVVLMNRWVRWLFS